MGWPPDFAGYPIVPVGEGPYQMERLGMTLYDTADVLASSYHCPDGTLPKKSFEARIGTFLRCAEFRGQEISIGGRFVEYSPSVDTHACLVWHLKPTGR